MGIESCLSNACRVAEDAITLSGEMVTNTDTIETDTDTLVSEAFTAKEAIANSDWQGEWSAGTYNYLDVVIHNGIYYICNTTTTTEPPNFTYWADIQVEDTVSVPPPLLWLDLQNSINIKSGVGTATFTREDNGTTDTSSYIDRYGVLQYADEDEPRFEKEGLLIEEGTTNICTYSQAFSGAEWDTFQMGVTDNNTTAPDGTTTATRLLPNTVGSVHTLSKSTTDLTLVDDTIYTVSCFFKAGGITDNVSMQVYDKSEAFLGGLSIDLENGTWTEGGTGTTGHTLTQLANGWIRVSFSFDAGSGTPTNFAFLRVAYNQTANGTTEDFYIWGMQVEANDSPTAYTPTLTTTYGTRNPDKLSVTHQNNMPLWKDPHSIIIDYDIHVDSVIGNRFLLTTGVLGNGYINGTTLGNVSYRCAGGGILNHSFANEEPVNGIRFIATNDGTTINSWADGVKGIDPETTGTDAETNTGIYIGSNTGGTDQLNGHVKTLKIYDYCATDEQARIM